MDEILSHSKLWNEMAKDGYTENEKTEFYNDMLERFNMTEEELLSFVTIKDASQLTNDRFVAIWNGLDFYNMDILDEFKQDYVNILHNIYYPPMDDRIEKLPYTLRDMIKEGTCINSKNYCSNVFVAYLRGHKYCFRLMWGKCLCEFLKRSQNNMERLNMSNDDVFEEILENNPSCDTLFH